MKKIIIVWAIVAGIGILGGLVIYPAIRKAGIRKRLEEAYKNPHSLDALGGTDKLLATGMFNTEYYPKATITRTQARERAKRIWDNYSSWLSSNQSAIVNAFTGLKHAHDVSKIANEFNELYKEDLLEILKSALTDKATFNLLMGKLQQLPNT